jgi:NaMN:DMB phosphoribosyltransferase
MKSISTLLFLCFLSAAAAFSLRSIPVSTKRIFLSANTNTVTEQPVNIVAEEAPGKAIILKTNDYLSSLPSNIIVGSAAGTTPLCNVYLEMINEPERYIATIHRTIKQGLQQKKSIWSMFFRYIGSAVRRIGRRNRESTV